jgi:hypothetical protein
MNDERRSIARKILITLYEAWENHTIESLEPIQTQSGLESGLFDALVDELERRRGLVKPYGSSYTYEITPAGILYAEDNGLIPEDRAAKHRKIRSDVLGMLAERYDRQGSFSEADTGELGERVGVDAFEILLDLSFLNEIGYIRDTSSNTFQITDEGIRAFRGTDNEDII